MTAGLLVMPGVWSQAFCNRVRQAIDAGEGAEAEIVDGTIGVDVSVRQALDVTIDPAMLAQIERRLAKLASPIGAFFDLALTASVGVTCLRYFPGGHYLPHRDCDPTPGSGTDDRRVSMILWLNSSASGGAPGGFEGGLLRLFAPDRDEPVELVPVAGTVVAFPSEWPHEVTAVTRGCRDVVVDWWLAY
jgi:predicted 2-oxoglutarate/Fe(II)-dependent dioxygenase YbiX